jgi:hypothetical protein
MRALNALLLVAFLLSVSTSDSSAESIEPTNSVSLSPSLLELFRAEMRELLLGTQIIAAALPIGDWDRVVSTSRQMKASYILEKKLTPAQEKELTALPANFKYLDQNFHARTEKLAEAALRRDSEAAAYHYSRLIEACAECHASFAPTHFPGLTVPSQEEHHHH